MTGKPLEKLINFKNLLFKKIDLIFFKFPGFKQLIKFSLVGLINTILDFSAYFVLTRTFNFFAKYYLLANGLSFSIAVTNSFIFNKLWTFGDSSKSLKHTSLKYFKFFFLNIVTLVVVEILMYFLVSRLHFYDLAVKASLVILSGLMNFCFSKFFIFKTSE